MPEIVEIPIGRAMVQALNLNRATMLAIRAEKELLGRHPPPSTVRTLS